MAETSDFSRRLLAPFQRAFEELELRSGIGKALRGPHSRWRQIPTRRPWRVVFRTVYVSVTAKVFCKSPVFPVSYAELEGENVGWNRIRETPAKPLESCGEKQAGTRPAAETAMSYLDPTRSHCTGIRRTL